MKRKIAVMIGSDSDLPQCREGLKYLLRGHQVGLIEVENNLYCQRSQKSL